MANLQPVLKALATKLIAKFGRDVTHVTVTSGEYNPDTGESSTKVEATIKGFVSAYSHRDYNAVIAIGDAPMLTTTEVKIDDEIIIDLKRYSITLVKSTPLENGIVVYEANLRATV